nr:hypothetical protein CFP56_40781 [Quercus suber]
MALGFEFGRRVLCEHEAANMSIGGKELNLMVSLTTSASTSSPNISRYFITSIIFQLPILHSSFAHMFAGVLLDFFLVQLILVRYLEPLFSFCILIASMLDNYYFGLLEGKIEMAVPYFHLAHNLSHSSFSMRGISAIIWL